MALAYPEPGRAPGTQIRTSAAAIWRAMLEDCARAQRAIDLEQYILKDDNIGRAFLSLFTEKARQGLRVRLMLDGVGSRGLIPSPALAAFREAGGTAHFFNPIGLNNALVPQKWLPRNHVKTLLVDGKTCYAGSACFDDAMAGWHDMQLRFGGALAAMVERYFDHLWERKDSPRPPGDEAHAGGLCWIVTQSGLRPNRIYQELLRGIGNARHSISIATPYFLPPFLLRHALAAAVRRGVKVRVMLNEKSDVGIADLVCRSYYPSLLRHGVRLFHYQGAVLHAKYVAIDDDWATIGSTNMDYLSLLQNREANVFIRDRETVRDIGDDFGDCLRRCREIGPGYHKNLPAWKRALGRLGRSLRRVL